MGKQKIGKFVFPDGNQVEQIAAALRQLGLNASAEIFPFFANKVMEENGTPYDFIQQLLRHEYEAREEIRIHRWLQQSKLFEITTVETYPYKQQPAVNPVLMKDLASCRFINEGKNILLLGAPGVGKTGLARGLGSSAILEGLETRFLIDDEFDSAVKRAADTSVKRLFQTLMRPKLLIFDDIEQFNTNEQSGKFLYDLIKQRYEQKLSIIITSNLAPSEWGNTLFGSAGNKSHMLDRILDHKRRIIVNITGKSLRVPEPPTPTVYPIETSHGFIKKVSAAFTQKA